MAVFVSRNESSDRLLGVTGNQYPNNPASFEFDISASGVWYSVGTQSGVWRTGNWYHVVGTYDGAYVRLYVNGVLVAANPANGQMTDYGEDVRIGTLTNRSDYTPGTIDEVTIYELALNGDEIRAIYEAGSAGKIKP